MNRKPQPASPRPLAARKRKKSKMPQRLLAVLTATVLAGATGMAHGAFIHETSVASKDRIIGERQSSGPATGYTTDANSNMIGVGGSTGSRTHEIVVVGLTLPTLGSGQSVDSAVLTFNITAIRDQGNANTLGSLDTYLLDIADPSTTGTQFFYESGTIQASAGGTDVEHVGRTTRSDLGVSTNSGGIENEITFNPPKGITYILTGDALDLLKSFYTGSTPDQLEAFFRFNQTSNLTMIDNDRYRIDPDSVKLTITAIPEPASLALMGLGGLLMLGRSRRA